MDDGVYLLKSAIRRLRLEEVHHEEDEGIAADTTVSQGFVERSPDPYIAAKMM